MIINRDVKNFFVRFSKKRYLAHTVFTKGGKVTERQKESNE